MEFLKSNSVKNLWLSLLILCCTFYLINFNKEPNRHLIGFHVTVKTDGVLVRICPKSLYEELISKNYGIRWDYYTDGQKVCLAGCYIYDVIIFDYSDEEYYYSPFKEVMIDRGGQLELNYD